MKSGFSKILILVIINTLILGFFVRLIPISTYQQVINGEEASFANNVLRISGIIKENVYSNVGRGYLHGYSLYLFVFLSKLFNPNLLFLKLTTAIFNLLFIITFIPLIFASFNKRCSRTNFNHSLIIISLIFLFLAIPPLVFQVWSAKVRLEFLETVYIGNILLFITAYYSQLISSKIIKDSLNNFAVLSLLLFFLIGCAFISQPLIIFYAIPIFTYLIIFLTFRKKRLLEIIISILIFVLTMPLISLASASFVSEVSEFASLEKTISFVGKEYNETGISVPSKRVIRIYTHVIPTFLGQKTESQSSDIIHEALTLFTASFSLTSIIWLASVSLSEIRNRNITIHTLIFFGLLSSVGIIYFSSFMSVYQESRRYFPFFSFQFVALILFLLMIARVKFKEHSVGFYISASFLTLLIVTNTYSLIMSGFYKSKFVKSYENMNVIVPKLREMGITQIYTNSWIGAPISFSTKGEILWTHLKASSAPSTMGYAFLPDLSKGAVVLRDYDKNIIDLLQNKCDIKAINMEKFFIIGSLEKCFHSYDEMTVFLQRKSRVFNESELRETL